MAQKLVKEMEDHKISRPSGVSVRNHYTIFLCPQDYERLRGRKDALSAKLERHLAKHVRAKKYDTVGEIKVEVAVDYDLQSDYFGVLAEWESPRLEEMAAPVGVGQRGQPGAGEGGLLAGAQPVSASLSTPGRAPAPVLTERRRARHVKPPGEAGGGSKVGTTEVIAAEDATGMGLARQTIVLRAGNQEREFSQSRVIVGRSRDVDFRINAPNVSRRHAAVFWSEGRIMIEDLGSTNGTMVNGYPVSSTVIDPGDKIVIGDCQITVETR